MIQFIRCFCQEACKFTHLRCLDNVILSNTDHSILFLNNEKNLEMIDLHKGRYPLQIIIMPADWIGWTKRISCGYPLLIIFTKARNTGCLSDSVVGREWFFKITKCTWVKKSTCFCIRGEMCFFTFFTFFTSINKKKNHKLFVSVHMFESLSSSKNIRVTFYFQQCQNTCSVLRILCILMVHLCAVIYNVVEFFQKKWIKRTYDLKFSKSFRHICPHFHPT